MKKGFEKVDNRVNYRVVIDTETLKNDLVYNIGITITDNRGKTIYSNEWIVQESFKYFCFDNFYSDNIDYYKHQFDYYKTLPQTSLKEIRKEIKKVLKNFKKCTIWAYNAQFDYSHLNYTYQKICGRNRPFLCGCWRDIMILAKNNIRYTKKYQNFCIKYNFFTPKGYFPFNAEKMYCFLANKPDFKEDHTALSDTKVESFILNKLLKKHIKTAESRRLYQDEIKQVKYLYDCLTDYLHTEKYIKAKFNLD